MAQIANLEIDAGATFRVQFLYANPDATDTPINLTGYSARMHIRERVESPTTVLELTSASGITITAAAGTLDVVIAASVTKDLVGPYVYDIEIESESGVVDRLAQGVVTVNPEVTRE